MELDISATELFRQIGWPTPDMADQRDRETITENFLEFLQEAGPDLGTGAELVVRRAI